mgnify:CR=1 FL=1
MDNIAINLFALCLIWGAPIVVVLFAMKWFGG